MNTKINLTYEGVSYTLEYDRMSIKMLEKAGFQYEEFLDKPFTNVELAFTGAFVKNHPKTSQVTIDKIYEECPNKGDLIAALSKMINECYETLLSDPEDKQGNATWEVIDLSPTKK
jgi:hypothetical protein